MMSSHTILTQYTITAKIVLVKTLKRFLLANYYYYYYYYYYYLG